MSKSEQGLQDAFAGESQANRNIRLCQEGEAEGFKQAAKLSGAQQPRRSMPITCASSAWSNRPENLMAAITGSSKITTSPTAR
jgi:hypothetical protein